MYLGENFIIVATVPVIFMAMCTVFDPAESRHNILEFWSHKPGIYLIQQVVAQRAP